MKEEGDSITVASSQAGSTPAGQPKSEVAVAAVDTPPSEEHGTESTVTADTTKPKESADPSAPISNPGPSAGDNGIIVPKSSDVPLVVDPEVSNFLSFFAAEIVFLFVT